MERKFDVCCDNLSQYFESSPSFDDYFLCEAPKLNVHLQLCPSAGNFWFFRWPFHVTDSISYRCVSFVSPTERCQHNNSLANATWSVINAITEPSTASRFNTLPRPFPIPLTRNINYNRSTLPLPSVSSLLILQHFPWFSNADALISDSKRKTATQSHCIIHRLLFD